MSPIINNSITHITNNIIQSCLISCYLSYGLLYAIIVLCVSGVKQLMCMLCV